MDAILDHLTVDLLSGRVTENYQYLGGGVLALGYLLLIFWDFCISEARKENWITSKIPSDPLNVKVTLLIINF